MNKQISIDDTQINEQQNVCVIEWAAEKSINVLFEKFVLILFFVSQFIRSIALTDNTSEFAFVSIDFDSLGFFAE